MKKHFLNIILSLFFIVTSISVLLSCGDSNKDISNESLVITPTEEYVITCLEKVPGIIEIQAVTEDCDPNNLLNKAGGYYACIYFSYSLVNQDEVLGNTLIEKGTDAGGCIEVYSDKNAANKRNDYLSSFDGTIFASGSHKVIGTLIVRTSDSLTASQQSLLEHNIILSLTDRCSEYYDESDYENFITFPARTAGGLSSISVSHLVYYPSVDAEAVYSSVDIEQFTYSYDDSIVGELTINFNFDCYITDMSDYAEYFAFEISAFNNEGNFIKSETVFGNGALGDTVRLQWSITLDILDVEKGIKISFEDYKN